MNKELSLFDFLQRADVKETMLAAKIGIFERYLRI